MRKRKYTEAEIAAREAKKTRMRELAARISALSPEQRNELAARAGVRTIEGRAVSTHNACMLFHQLDGVSVVGGFHQWRKAGRIVTSGKGSGLTIWAPTGTKDPESGEIGEKSGFVMVSVFDISQTKPLDDSAPADEESPQAAGWISTAAGDSAEMPATGHAYEIDGKLTPVSFQLEIV